MRIDRLVVLRLNLRVKNDNPVVLRRFDCIRRSRRRCCRRAGRCRKHKLIVEQHVTNAGSDLGLLAPTAGAAEEVLGVERIEAAADRGYYKGEDVQACEDVGIEAYIARPQRGSAVRDGLFRKEEFRYDPTSDTYRCPGGQQLYPLYRCGKGDHTTVQYCNRDACRGCELKPQCTANTYRRVGRWTEEAVLDRMEARLAARPEIV